MKHIIIIFIALSSVFSFAQSDKGSKLKVGDKAANFSVSMLDGDVIALSDLKGKAVLVIFGQLGVDLV
ncbi:MAG: hypothetical protein WA775_01370 [Psychroserpens sp.]|uniref:hypothetical protein n=1 Tax=Psychroserpens sp. TaxID=2020870 RepID=UPI003CA530F5